MKTLSKALMLPAVLAMFVARSFSADVSDLLEEAQRAYIRGEVTAAKEKFGLVRKFAPNNRTADFYLRRIAAEEAAQQASKVPPNATKTALAKIVIEKVDFREAALTDVLEFLRQKGGVLSNGKLAINFVQQIEESMRNAKVTLSLQNIPFTEALKYVGELADVQFVYEPYAIVVKPRGSAPPPGPNAAAQPRNEVKIPGL